MKFNLKALKLSEKRDILEIWTGKSNRLEDCNKHTIEVGDLWEKYNEDLYTRMMEFLIGVDNGDRSE